MAPRLSPFMRTSAVTKPRHQGLMLLRIEIPQRATSALAWENQANQHHLDHIDELDVLGYHALDARLQCYQLIGRTPVRTLLDPGGESHGGTGAEFGSRGPGGATGFCDLEPLSLSLLHCLHESTFRPGYVG